MRKHWIETPWLHEVRHGPVLGINMVKEYYINKGYKQGVKAKNAAVFKTALLFTGLGAGGMWLISQAAQKKKQRKIEESEAEGEIRLNGPKVPAKPIAPNQENAA